MDAITLPQTLFTVQDLSTLAGLVVAVYVIVSFFKGPLKVLAKKFSLGQDGDWIVRPFTVIVAFGILLWLTFIQGTVTTEAIGLAVINSFLVALISGAAHDYIVAPTKSKKLKKNYEKQIVQKDDKKTAEELVNSLEADEKGKDSLEGE